MVATYRVDETCSGFPALTISGLRNHTRNKDAKRDRFEAVTGRENAFDGIQTKKTSPIAYIPRPRQFANHVHLRCEANESNTTAGRAYRPYPSPTPLDRIRIRGGPGAWTCGG